MTLPSGKFKVVLADPPWAFKTYSKKGMGKSAEKHYQTMTLADICALPVSDIADKNSTLLIWTTGPMYEKTMQVIKAWGFTYKTLGFVWMKKNRKSDGLFVGMGYWTRSNAELCLLATRGKPKRISKRVRQAILAPVREHSRKPEEAYTRIEELLAGPYIELFARTTRPGWTAWGNESEKFN